MQEKLPARGWAQQQPSLTGQMPGTGELGAGRLGVGESGGVGHCFC